MTMTEMANAQHSAKSSDHGTPADVVDAARLVLGGFDLDPASSEEHNETIKADKIYTKENNGLIHPWCGRVFLNPPGTCGLEVCKNARACSCKLVRKFWNKLVREYRIGNTTSAIWIGFSLEQLASLQNNTEKSPLDFDFPLCFPRKRMNFRGNQPTHANYIALLSHRARTRFRFGVHFAKFGAVRM